MDALINSFKSVKPDKDGKISDLNNNILIEALRWIDTVHDFYPVSSTARGEDIREILNKRYDPSDPVNGVKSFMSKISTIAPSSVEEDTEKYYNQKFNTIMVGKKTIDVKNIMESYGVVADAKTFLENNGISDFAEEADLQLSLTDRSGFKDIPKTNFLANVILTFFFGAANKDKNVYFLIDANSGRLDCMFQDIAQASILINVLTIGDSANTKTDDSTGEKESATCGLPDFQNKYKRKTYLQNPYTVPYNKIDQLNPVNSKYEIKSTEFTKDILELWYQSVPGLEFAKQNNASIRFCVKPKDSTDQPWFTEFSILSKGSPNSGASVGTLKKLILILDTNKSKEVKKQEIFKFYKTVNQLNLAKILFEMLDANIDEAVIISFLYDYKRAGDHEQVNSANYLYRHETMPENVILVTGDRLCSLYARLIKQPCIYAHKKYYDMYRYLRGITPEQEKTQAVFLLKNSIETIPTELNAINTTVIKDKLDKLENLITDEWTSDGEELEDKLYALVFKSLKVKIDRLKKQVEEFDTERDKTLESIKSIPILDESSTTDTITASSKALIDNYINFKNKYKEIFDFYSYIDEDVKPDKKKFISDALDYDNKIVKNIQKYFIDFEKGIMVFKTRDNTRIAAKRTFINSLGGEKYNTLIADFIEFINNCNLYIHSEKKDADKIMLESSKIKLEINEKIAEELNKPNIESHPYENYKPVVDKIKQFFEDELKKNVNIEASNIPMDVEEEEAIVPRSQTPRSRSTTPTPRSRTPTPRSRTPTPRSTTPTPRSTTPTPRSTTPTPRSTTPTPRSTTPTPMDIDMDGGASVEADKKFLIKINERIVKKQNEMFKFMKIHLYEWLHNAMDDPKELTILKDEYGLLNTTIKKINEIKKNIFDISELNDFRREESGFDKILNAKDAELKTILTYDDFENILNVRLKYEYFLYYGDVKYLGKENKRQNEILMNGYINPILDQYYGELIELHRSELINAYFEKINDEEPKDQHIKNIYNFIYSECLIYQSNIYKLIYYTESAEERKDKQEITNKKRERERESESERESEETGVPDVDTLLSVERINTAKKQKTYNKSFTTSGGNKKRTRKYKNRHNKKTRQRRKNTRKNRTLKKKRGKGKRTRRISI